VGALLAYLALGSSWDSSAAGLVGTLAPSSDDAAAQGQPSGLLSPIFTPEIQYWARSILGWAAAAGLDPDLAATVMQIESCGDPRALSRSGAIGLFQVMPYHFAAGEDPYDPDTNARRGLDYLRRSMAAAGGEPRLALAGYNGGIGVIGRLEASWAIQTQRYAYWGSGIYLEATSAAGFGLRLQEWLRTSGLSLCRQASRRLGLTSE
jgi:soluble lytic murein transglycosylase-like protein